MRKVSVTIERFYSKRATIDIEVDDFRTDESLRKFLAENEIVDTLLENSLSESSLTPFDTLYEYQDPTNNDGGHL